MSKPGENTRPRRVLEPEQVAARKQRIANAVRAGNSIKEIARLYRVHHGVIARICDDMGVARPKPGNGSRWG